MAEVVQLTFASEIWPRSSAAMASCSRTLHSEVSGEARWDEEAWRRWELTRVAEPAGGQDLWRKLDHLLRVAGAECAPACELVDVGLRHGECDDGDAQSATEFGMWRSAWARGVLVEVDHVDNAANPVIPVVRGQSDLPSTLFLLTQQFSLYRASP